LAGYLRHCAQCRDREEKPGRRDGLGAVPAAPTAAPITIG
jgi:hypothetical protein